MKILGIVLVIIGLIWAVIAFNMQTTVTSPSQDIGSGDYAIQTPSVTVNNIGLMDRRRNNLMFAGLTILVGVVLVGFGSLTKKSATESTNFVVCPFCAEPVRPEAIVCKHCGKDIGSKLAEAAEATVATKEKQRASFADANRDKLRELCSQLEEQSLNYDQYEQLAKAAGASMGLLTVGLGSHYVVTTGSDKVTFTSFKALRPWFLENIVPKIRADA